MYLIDPHKNTGYKFFTYGLYAENSPMPLYIGKSGSDYLIDNRLKGHITKANNKKLSNLIIYKKLRKLRSKNIKWYMRIIKWFSTEVEALGIEEKLIKLIGIKIDKSGYLYNMSYGGESGFLSVEVLREKNKNQRIQAGWDEKEILQMKDLYDYGYSCKEIGEFFFLEESIINRRLHYCNTVFRSNTACNSKYKDYDTIRYKYYNWSPELEDKIILMYEKENKTLSEISKEIGLSIRAIRIRLLKLGVSMRDNSSKVGKGSFKWKSRIFKNLELCEQIKTSYLIEKLSLQEIINKFNLNITIETLGTNLTKLGVLLRSRGEGAKLKHTINIPKEIEVYIKTEINSGKSIRTLSKELDISRETIRKRLLQWKT